MKPSPCVIHAGSPYSGSEGSGTGGRGEGGKGCVYIRTVVHANYVTYVAVSPPPRLNLLPPHALPLCSPHPHPIPPHPTPSLPHPTPSLPVRCSSPTWPCGEACCSGSSSLASTPPSGPPSPSLPTCWARQVTQPHTHTHTQPSNYFSTRVQGRVGVRQQRG